MKSMHASHNTLHSDMNKSGGFANLQQTKIAEVFDLLKQNTETYWQILEGLTNEQKIEIFIRILKKELPLNRSEFQLKFLSQQCMQFEFFRNISQNYGDEIVRNCVRCLRYQDLQSDQILFEQGERGTRFYIILQGAVHILIKLPEKGNVRKFKNQRINTIHSGKAFGEVALMNDNTMRTATIKSAEYCRFAYLEKDDFKNIIGVQATEQINQRYMFIKDYNFFDEFTYRELITFSYHFNEATYKRGEIIYDISDKKIDDVFFVKEGQFMLQGSFDITQSYIPNLKVKRQHRTFNIDLLVERSIFGLEYFNKQVLKETHFKIKALEEMSSSEQQTSSKSNQPNANAEQAMITFSPYRISRVICDSTRGTVYRVKASEIEQRLWKEDSKQKWSSLSQVIFQKQVQKILQFIERSLEERSQLELLREQDAHLKPAVEYLGRVEDLKHLYDSGNQTTKNSQTHLSHKPTEKQIDSSQFKSSPSLMKVGAGSPLNNHISLLLDVDKFMKSSIDVGFDRSPFNLSIQKIKNMNVSPSLSPIKLKSTIQPCLISSNKSVENSPRKGKNVTISDFNKTESIFSPMTRKHHNGSNTQTSIGKAYANNHKNFSLCVFHTDENNGSSLILGKKKQNSSQIIHEEEDGSEKMYGSSLILNKKYSPERSTIHKTNSMLSFHSNEDLLKLQRVYDLQNQKEIDEEDNEYERLQKQKKQLKQCSPPKRSPEKQAIHEEKQIQKSDKKFKKDFVRKVGKMIKSEQKSQSTNSKATNQEQPKPEQIPPKSPIEMVNKIFYFAHDHNDMHRREEEVQKFKKHFLGDDPEETNISNVIRGNTDSKNVENDQDLLQATTLDDYKRRKFQRKLMEEQDNKFQKLFSNDLVDLGKINQQSEYNDRVKNLYMRNKKENKIIFDKTAEIVKQQNCSYNQVREYFYKLNHKDRFFQDMFAKKAKQQAAKSLNHNNSTSSSNKMANEKSVMGQEDLDVSQHSQTQSNITGNLSSQLNVTPKKASYSSMTPHRRRTNTLVLKEKRPSSNVQNFMNNNPQNQMNNKDIMDNSMFESPPNVNNFDGTQENVKLLSAQDQSIVQLNKSNQGERSSFKFQDLQYQEEIDMLKKRPDYLSYLLQKNLNSNEIPKSFRGFEQLTQTTTPIMVQPAQGVESEQDYYIKQALKIHQALKEQEQEQQFHNVEEFQIDKAVYHSFVGKQQQQPRPSQAVYSKTEADEDYQQRTENKTISQENDHLFTLKQTEGTPRMQQNHLVHLKYTPTYNKTAFKTTPFSQTAYNFSKENMSQMTVAQYNQYQLNHSNNLKKKNSNTLETSTLKKQIISPDILDTETKPNSRSLMLSKSPNALSHQLSVSFNNSSQKQELSTTTKNTFLSQNHRKQIVDQRIKQRELFLRSKSSVKRYSFASTNFTESSRAAQQIDVNSKCLAQIPGWNHRPSTSQSISQHKKHMNKFRIQPRSLQIASSVSPNKQTHDSRIMTTMSVYESSTPIKRNNFSTEESSVSPFIHNQQSMHLQTSFSRY